MSAFHDDNFSVTKGPSGTTLVLSADTYALLDSNVNIDTPKLAVYAETIAFGSEIKSSGKTIQLHCNNLLLGDSLSLDVSGSAGDETPDSTDSSKANGGAGGSIVLHVHNMPLYPGTDSFSLFEKEAKFNVAGGAAGKYKNGEGNMVGGSTGSPGTVRVYYSNPMLRALCATKEIHLSKDSFPRRLALLRTRCLPTLDNEISKMTNQWASSLSQLSWLKSVTDEWRADYAAIKEEIDFSFDLHVLFVRIAELLKTNTLPTSISESVDKVLAFFGKVQFMPDYSAFPKDIKSVYEKLAEAVDTWLGLGPDRTPKGMEVCLTYLNAELKTVIENIPSVEDKVSQMNTPLGDRIAKVHSAFIALLQKCEEKLKGSCQPSENFTVMTVSTSLDGSSDLNVDVALVHPDQCSMARRRADAAFFAEDYKSASTIYTTLLEKFSFLPRVRDNKNEGIKDLPAEPWPLHMAFDRMEQEEGLCLWGLDTLVSMSKEIQALMGQMSIGVDMFNLRETWAPRLSFKYYFDYANQQLDRLKTYEASYWRAFEQNQTQAEIRSALRATVSVSIYQQRDAEERLKSSAEAFQRIDGELAKMKPEYHDAAEKLKKNLEAVENKLKEHKYVSVARIVGAISTVIAGIAVAFTGPAGWVGTLLLESAAGCDIVGMIVDASTKIEDSFGQVINKEVIIRGLDTCDGDLKDLVNSQGYTTKADGTKLIEGGGTAKIVVTEGKLKSFLDEFKGKFPENEELKTSLDDFVKISQAQNNKIVAYNNAVMDCYHQILQRATFQKQITEASSELIKENRGLPSILGFYRQLRDQMRLSFLRTVKHSVLALRFWGLQAAPRFNSITPPGMLSNLDELEAHMGVLSLEYEGCLTTFGRLSRITWPKPPGRRGITYKLTQNELSALKGGSDDPLSADICNRKVQWNITGAEVSPSSSKPRLFTTTVTGLQLPSTRVTTLAENPFAGYANVRITQVYFRAPNLRFAGEKSTALNHLSVEIRHEGVECIVDSRDQVHTFEHWPVQVLSVTDPNNSIALVRQSVAPENEGLHLNEKVQAPIGPFAVWRISIREKDQGGPLSWEDVKDAYLDFEGYAVPFEG
ncbi:hypothetical protein PEBR_17189 [Penicillium brasilianum]|uniref:Uncharacterized protein n=1 Tax=Penicillium brasilianum TaxID=104259 RepID=A0A1S9RPE5_PENBI|nr:hypothetical protein PEBR_17189 [Penicillium brasilianum]